MKRYINCYEHRQSGYYYGTAEEAREAAMSDAYAVAVEIELPNPPHEWKVNDWLDREDQCPLRIVDIDDEGNVAMHGRVSGHVFVLWANLADQSFVAGAPCDPPAWFTEGGAS